MNFMDTLELTAEKIVTKEKTIVSGSVAVLEAFFGGRSRNDLRISRRRDHADL